VQAVLLQDPGAQVQYEQCMNAARELEVRIPSEINSLFSIQSQISDLQEEIAGIGDEKGIEAYVTELRKDLNRLTADSGLSPEERVDYEKLSDAQKALTSNIENLVHDRAVISGIPGALKPLALEIEGIVKGQLAALTSETIRAEATDHFKVVFDLAEAIADSTKSVLEHVQQSLNTTETSLNDVTAKIRPLLSKVALQSELEKKLAAIKAEQEKLNRVRILKKTLAVKSQSEKEKISDILGAYREMMSQFDTLQAEFKKYEGALGDILLSVALSFDSLGFRADLVDQFLNKHSLRRIVGIEWGDEFYYAFDKDRHPDDIDKLFQGIYSGSIPTVKRRTPKDAAVKLLENRFSMDYRISYRNDSLDKMSPGKKGLVLLRLIIELSDKQWPILLDQPEDDLDSRSVYLELVAFLKAKKKQRQIIIVTHNPNLVVGADAEEVIVANQDGQEPGRDNEKYRFEYVSGALENSFDEPGRHGVLYQKGIREHVCDVLEGGKEAFQKREQKYSF